jgi:ubiquinone/menaquinone biosynthesis C-methylase UbiE
MRSEVAGLARGVTLEIGVGSGLNFALYPPGQVERVEAIEPDATMLRYAEQSRQRAPVPITLTQAPAEALPFADETFDSALATLVFCSVRTRSAASPKSSASSSQAARCCLWSMYAPKGP